MGISFVYANEPSTAKDSLYAEDKLRKEPQTFSHLNVKCRGLTNAELKTQIVDFDIERGITYCEIYKKTNPDFIMSTDADAFWVLHNSGETQNIQGLTKIQGKTSNIGKSTGNSSSGDTFSTFFSQNSAFDEFKWLKRHKCNRI